MAAQRELSQEALYFSASSTNCNKCNSYDQLSLFPEQGQGSSPKAMRQVTQRASLQGQPAVPVPAAAAAAATPPPDQAQGVWFDADKQLWVAEARLGGRCIPVGTFESETEALRAHRATLEAVKIKSEAVAPGDHPCLTST